MTGMRTLLRTLLVTLFAVGTIAILSACSGGSPGPAPAPVPTTATYVADMQTEGKKMSIGISVDGDHVTAYACNGVDDEAWFFGDQSGGRVDVTSKFRDTLTATVDGSDVSGTVVMNGVSYAFTANEVKSPAGVYTVAVDGVRSSWIVRPDGSVTGVQFAGGVTGRDFEQAELQQLNAAQFQVQVRNKRVLQQADQSVSLRNGTLVSKVNGRTVTARTVTGSTRFG